MEKETLRKNQKRIQQHLVVWVVLTIVLQILTVLTGWPFLQFVAWLAAAYCVLLIAGWCWLEWRLLHL